MSELANFFEELENVDNKHKSKCILRGFQYGHSHATVWCASESARFHIYFESIEFINCPVRWVGLDLSLGSDNETLAILISKKLIPNDDSIKHKKLPYLFKFNLGDNEYGEIIASYAKIYMEKS